MATETRKKMNIPITKPALGEDEARAPYESIKSGWVTQGPKVAEFERAVASYVGARHGIATTSCTTGLHLALASIGVGRGDEVIVPSFTFIASPFAVSSYFWNPIRTLSGPYFSTASFSPSPTLAISG